MSLSQILGLTHEIKIIDFLVCNPDMPYSVDELQDFTDIDTSTIKYLLPKLQYNGLVEVEGEQVKLCKNEIVSALIRTVYENSYVISGYPDEVDENNYVEWRKRA